MLTFKQSVILLVSIITVLAIIAVATGLSPLYWPRPKNFVAEGNSSLIIVKMASSSTVKTQRTTRLNATTKKILQSTTTTITTALPVTMNATVI